MAYYGSQGGGQRNGGYGNYHGDNYRNNPQWHEAQGLNNAPLDFINPYQFVPLNGSVERKPIGDWRGQLTGRIRCRLTLKTPLALPDHEKGQPTRFSGHISYPLMRMGDTPFIPGSTLRGMIRSVYEAATNSCLSILDNSPLHGRSSDIREPGLLSYEGGKWMLYPAKSCLIKTYASGFNSNGVYPINEKMESAI